MQEPIAINGKAIHIICKDNKVFSFLNILFAMYGENIKTNILIKQAINPDKNIHIDKILFIFPYSLFEFSSETNLDIVVENPEEDILQANILYCQDRKLKHY